MKRTTVALLISILALPANTYHADAAIKPGSPCKTNGQVTTSSGMKYTCIKKSGKLIWGKGVKVKSSEKGITVDKNLFSVEVTVPASFYKDQKITQEELDADTAKKGYGKAKINKDGSVTFQMSKAQHSKALAEMKKSVDDYIQETVNEYPDIFQKISYNKNMTEFNISVDKLKFEEDFAAGMISFGIGILSAFYQMFSGGIDSPKTVIKLTDVSTGKVFDTQNWPLKN
jgi:hypothetical protein